LKVESWKTALVIPSVVEGSPHHNMMRFFGYVQNDKTEKRN